MDPARNGSEQRLDAIIDALQGISHALTDLVSLSVPAVLVSTEGDVVELREPEAEPKTKPAPKARKK